MSRNPGLALFTVGPGLSQVACYLLNQGWVANLACPPQSPGTRYNPCKPCSVRSMII